MEKAAIIESPHDGVPLLRRLRERQVFSVDDALEFTGKLSGLLDRLHKQDLYHGTLRLENVFIDTLGEPLLDDFGFLAEALRQIESVGPIDGRMLPESALNLVKFSPKNHFEFFRLGLILYFLIDGWEGRFQQRRRLYYPSAISRQEALPQLDAGLGEEALPLNRLLTRLMRKEPKPFGRMQDVSRELVKCQRHCERALAIAAGEEVGEDIVEEPARFEDSHTYMPDPSVPSVEEPGQFEKPGYALGESEVLKGMAQARRKKARRKAAADAKPLSRGIIATLVLLLALIPASFLLSLEVDKVTTKNPLVKIPDLVGKTYGEARDAMESLGLNLIVSSKNFSDGAPVNAVIRQTPNPGAIVRTGREIKIALSLGPSTRTMPNLVGHNLDEKRDVIIETYGLRLGQIKRRVSNSPSGDILQQDPKPGAVIERGAAISLTVSMGPARETVRVPSLTGIRLNEAIEAAGRAGLRVGKVTKNYSYTALEENVYEQAPGAGDVIAAGGAVELSVRVPDYGIDEETRFFKIAVSVPPSYESVRVKVILSDDKGRNKIHDRVHRGGESWEKGRIPVNGLARYQVLFDEALRFEFREIQGGR